MYHLEASDSSVCYIKLPNVIISNMTRVVEDGIVTSNAVSLTLCLEPEVRIRTGS